MATHSDSGCGRAGVGDVTEETHQVHIYDLFHFLKRLTCVKRGKCSAAALTLRKERTQVLRSNSQPADLTFPLSSIYIAHL